MTSSEPSSKSSNLNAPRLRGQTVLIPRAIDQAEPLQSELEAHGASVIIHPVIQILALSDLSKLDDSITRLSQFDRIVFASRNAAKYFIDRVIHFDRIEAVRQTRLSAIGQSTADFLTKLLADRPKSFTPSKVNSQVNGRDIGKR